MFGSFWEVARHIFTALYVKFLALVRVRLKIEVFWISKLLENAPNISAKVRVRLKLECGLIERVYGIMNRRGKSKFGI